MSLKAFFIEKAVQVILSVLDEEMIRDAVRDATTRGRDILDSLIDRARVAIEDSDSKIDDAVLLPVLEMLERVLGLPEG